MDHPAKWPICITFCLTAAMVLANAAPALAQGKQTDDASFAVGRNGATVSAQLLALKQHL